MQRFLCFLLNSFSTQLSQSSPKVPGDVYKSFPLKNVFYSSRVRPGCILAGIDPDGVNYSAWAWDWDILLVVGTTVPRLVEYSSKIWSQLKWKISVSGVKGEVVPATISKKNCQTLKKKLRFFSIISNFFDRITNLKRLCEEYSALLHWYWYSALSQEKNSGSSYIAPSVMSGHPHGHGRGVPAGDHQEGDEHDRGEHQDFQR